MRRARLLVAEPETLFAEGLRKLLTPRFRVVAVVKDEPSLLAALTRLHPDVAICHIRMEGLNALRRLASAARIILLGTTHFRFDTEEARGAGVLGFLLTRCAPRELYAAIRAAIAGRSYVTPLLAAEPVQRLTPRQREVLRLVALGYSGKQIAGALGISPKTAQFHKTLLMRTLGISSTAGLTRYAIERGLVD